MKDVTKKIYMVPETAMEQFLDLRDIMTTTPGTMGGGSTDANVDNGDFQGPGAPGRRVVF